MYVCTVYRLQSENSYRDTKYAYEYMHKTYIHKGFFVPGVGTNNVSSDLNIALLFLVKSIKKSLLMHMLNSFNASMISCLLNVTWMMFDFLHIFEYEPIH